MDTISYIKCGNENCPIDAVTVNGVTLTSICSYYNPANNIMYFFKSAEDKNTFIADKTQTSLALFSTEVSDYIEFKDPNVKSVMAANFGDGTGVTYARAKRQLSMSSVFTDNSNISVFDEFKYFTGTTSMFEAFKNSSIKKITLPKGVTWTNNGSAFGLIFYGCTQLQEIDFADFTRSSAAFAGQFQVFSSCSSLTTLHFDSIEQINNLQKNTYTQSDVPFGYNSGAHKVYVQNDMYEDELLTNLVIPNSITAIRTAAFYRFNCITSVTIPDTVTSIGDYAFYQCYGISSLTLSNNLTSIGQYAFHTCTGLTSITLPSTLTSIGVYALNSCSNLQSLTIPSSVSNVNIDSIGGACTNTGGTIIIEGNLTQNRGWETFQGKDIIIKGNVTLKQTTPWCAVSKVETLRIMGNISYTVNNGNIWFAYSSSAKAKFIELMGVVNGTVGRIANTSTCLNAGGAILHLGYNGIAMTPSQAAVEYSTMTKVYVGPGESQAGDQAILDLYLADSSWAQYSSKLDLWYNYNGIYKN